MVHSSSRYSRGASLYRTMSSGLVDRESVVFWDWDCFVARSVFVFSRGGAVVVDMDNDVDSFDGDDSGRLILL